MQKLLSLFTTRPLDPSWFNLEFLKRVPIAQIEQIVTEIKSALGELKDAQISDGHGFVHFANGRVPVRIGLDGEERIETLWFGAPQFENVSFEDLVSKLKSAAIGEAAIFVAVDGKPVWTDNSEKPMAVGSAFKLIVLQAYEEAVKAGEIA
jgi:hypothetical protein